MKRWFTYHMIGVALYLPKSPKRADPRYFVRRPEDRATIYPRKKTFSYLKYELKKKKYTY